MRASLRFRPSWLFFSATALIWSATDARADIVTLQTAVDFQVNDTNGDGTFDFATDGAFQLSVRRFDGLLEDRSILEFNTSSIPLGAIIDSVALQFEVFSTTSPSSNVNIVGFTGNGNVDPSDATAVATLLGSYNPGTSGLGIQTISLNPALFQSLVLGSPTNFLALRLQGAASGVNTQFDSSESPFGIDPQLQVNFTPAAVPEPNVLMLLGLAGVGGGILRRRRKTTP